MSNPKVSDEVVATIKGLMLHFPCSVVAKLSGMSRDTIKNWKYGRYRTEVAPNEHALEDVQTYITLEDSYEQPRRNHFIVRD